MQFIAGNIVDALAPTNFPWSNPEVLKRMIEAGGLELPEGGPQFARDVSRPPRLPANVNGAEFVLGRNIAVSSGAVVVRDERFELIQYQATGSELREVPLLIVPPMVNKFYIFDLAPGRSLIEYLVGARPAGVRDLAGAIPTSVIAIGVWTRTPGRCIDALDADRRDLEGAARARARQLRGRDAVAATWRPTSLDVGSSTPGEPHPGGLRDRQRAQQRDQRIREQAFRETRRTRSSRKGYLDGRDLASVFLWLRPNELIWPYVVNNWLLGKIRRHSTSFTGTPTPLVCPRPCTAEFLTIATENSLREPGAVTVLGSPVDLLEITVDSYLVAGIADHITPWQNCYRTTQLLGGSQRFVLSTSGHIAAIINPPSNKRASYRTAGSFTPPSAEEWLSKATLSEGPLVGGLGRLAR